jgi:hypothetical protein
MKLLIVALLLSGNAFAQPAPPPPPQEDCGCGVPASPRGPR